MSSSYLAGLTFDHDERVWPCQECEAPEDLPLSAEVREGKKRHVPIFITGALGCGKSTVARSLKGVLLDLGALCVVVNQDLLQLRNLQSRPVRL